MFNTDNSRPEESAQSQQQPGAAPRQMQAGEADQNRQTKPSIEDWQASFARPF